MCADVSASAGFAPRAGYRRRVARILRSAFPADGIFHLTARGVDGTAVVRDRHDGLAFLRWCARSPSASPSTRLGSA